ncbi:MAG TPA: hypothetical protein VF229_07070, partial [Burkholderiaceae bacterium]
LIPRTLSFAVARTFPGYRTPLEFDNAPEDNQANAARGGTGCAGVATGDLAGDHTKVYVLGLASSKGSKGLAVIAFPRRGGWDFHRITSGVEDARFKQYVGVAPPGPYRRAATVTAPLAPGEKQSIDCPHAAAVAGSVEGSKIVYCYDRGQWSYVRVSD